jgi:hypothetical protein
METSIAYTQAEIDLLCHSLKHEYDEYLADDLRRAIRDIDNHEELLKERRLHHKYMDIETSSVTGNYMLYGEGRSFVIFYNRLHLDFEFWIRHLKHFLYKAELKDMPLMINTYFVKTLASWRLQIAK